MATLEQVEKLRQRADVSYDEAKMALSACNDDLLEAMIYLEQQGKVTPPANGGFYSSRLEMPPQEGKQSEDTQTKKKGDNFGELLKRFWNWLCKIFHKANTNIFEIWRNEQRTMAMPITVLVLLLIFFFWVTLPLLIVGLFFGFRYTFVGPDMDKTAANRVMNSAANTAANIKSEIFQNEKEDRETPEQ